VAKNTGYETPLVWHFLRRLPRLENEIGHLQCPETVVIGLG
jgi:hypothetical protein